MPEELNVKKMKTKHLKKRVRYFKALQGLSKKDIKQYMVECPDTLIDVICEACYNLLYNPKLKHKEDLCEEIKPFGDYLKKLSKQNVPVSYKRNVLQKIGVHIVLLIERSILPLLKSIT